MSQMARFDPILPFGKHKGEQCSAVPVGYLDWLIGQDWLGAQLKHEITEHLKTRADWHALDDDGRDDGDGGEDVDWKSPDFLK